ncbi:hypothetical protein ACFOKI_15870 [Sphingomonas qilianensis]|uniref:Terminase small subunit protein n=1 Tax=Sphingomonas qilianensis TaxID=1736690 RepID=A0ABU9XWB2_9SPHN
MTDDETRAALQATICERLADGLSLREICRGEGMPGKSTVMRWLAADEAFRGQYATARFLQADALADEVLEISDDGRNDWMERFEGDKRGPGYDLNGEHVQRSKLRVDSRKWLAGKIAPKKYGDAALLKLGGHDGGEMGGGEISAAVAGLASLAASLLTKGN